MITWPRSHEILYLKGVRGFPIFLLSHLSTSSRMQENSAFHWLCIFRPTVADSEFLAILCWTEYLFIWVNSFLFNKKLYFYTVLILLKCNPKILNFFLALQFKWIILCMKFRQNGMIKFWFHFISTSKLHEAREMKNRVMLEKFLQPMTLTMLLLSSPLPCVEIMILFCICVYFFRSDL